MINSVDNINFRGWRTVKMFLPRKFVGYSTHTPREANMTYGYFMQKKEKQNLLKKFFNSIIEKYNK